MAARRAGSFSSLPSLSEDDCRVTMTTIVDSDVQLPAVMGSFSSGITHCASRLRAFHRTPGAVSPSSAGRPEQRLGCVRSNLMQGDDRVLIENLKKQQLLYTSGEKGGTESAD
ncbi:hypothetical protein ACNKHM_08470 [Shigella sonnei]